MDHLHDPEHREFLMAQLEDYHMLLEVKTTPSKGKMNTLRARTAWTTRLRVSSCFPI